MQPIFESPSAVRERAVGLVRWLAFLLLAGHLLFAHGCHGDEDHELFGTLKAMVTRGSPDGAR